jgi:hypothetical protein
MGADCCAHRDLPDPHRENSGYRRVLRAVLAINAVMFVLDGLPVSEVDGTRSCFAGRNRTSRVTPEAFRQIGSFGLRCPRRLGNKKPGREAELFGFDWPICLLAEDASCVDDTGGCRKQPNSD